MQCRRSEELRSLPLRPQRGLSCPAPDRRQLSSAARSPTAAAPAVPLGQAETRGARAASDSTLFGSHQLCARRQKFGTMRNQNARLSQLRENLFWLVGLLRHLGPTREKLPNFESEHFIGRGSNARGPALAAGVFHSSRKLLSAPGPAIKRVP